MSRKVSAPADFPDPTGDGGFGLQASTNAQKAGQKYMAVGPKAQKVGK